MEEFAQSPEGMIIKRLKELFNRYRKDGGENVYNIIDYMSEWALLYMRERHTIEIMRQKLEQNLLNNGKEGKLKLLDFYNNPTFKEYTATPEKFMCSLIGERDWQNIQNRFVLRTDYEKKYVMDKIREKLEENKSYLLKLAESKSP